MTNPDGRNGALAELAEILAEGYLRLLARRRVDRKDYDDTSHSRENSSLIALDNTSDQGDVSGNDHGRNRQT